MYKIHGNILESYNPANKQKIGDVQLTAQKEIQDIVLRAKEAFPLWKKLSYKERAVYLNRLADYLDKNARGIAELMTKEMGRPLTESIPEVTKSARFLRYFADNTEMLLNDEIIDGVVNKDVRLVFEPYGVVALIKPWNMPLQTPVWALAPALMAGNAVVLKPSENTLLVAKELEKAITICNFPKDIVNFVYGDKEQGRQLLDCDIDMVSFTGSVAAGKAIASQVAGRLIKTSLELGGKDPMIVFPDVDIDFAAMAAVWGSTTNCGQFCSSIERVYVHKSIFEQFVKRAAEMCKAIKVGDGLCGDIEMGPVVNEAQYEKILSQINDAVKCGAKVVTGGDCYKMGDLSKGLFIQPTVIINLKNNMRIMQEETFGPIVRIMPFSTEEEAIKLANDTTYGLGSAIFTQNKDLVQRVSSEIEAGMVWVNEPLLSHEKCPWIPRKNSGLGYELGTLGLKEFTRVKMVSAQFTDNNKMRSWWYPYKAI